MKHLLTFFLTILLLWGIPGQNVAKNQQSVDYSEAIHLLDIWLEAQRDYDNLPGISVAIVKDQDIIWSKGYGMADLDKKVAASPKTIYSICSISKLFTSIAIMQLRDTGKLRLDDPVASLLPWFNIKQQWPDQGPITVRSLLTHSSGLPRESDYPYWTGPDFPFPTRKQLKDKLGSQKTLYPPSTYFQYSNLGLSLLGEIVSHVSGLSFEQYIQDNILTPLGLASTRTKLPGSLWRGQLASGYSAIKRDRTRSMLEMFQARGIAPAAGFSSTVRDLAVFASWQFRLLKKGGKEILHAATLREMQRVHWMDPDWKTSWGLGFSVRQENGKTLVGHGGSCPGYRSTLVIDPQKKWAFVVMTNAGDGNPGKYALGMREVIKKALADKEDKKGKKIDFKAYLGLYDSQPWSGELAVVSWQGKLATFGLPSSNPGKRMTMLKYEKKDTFRRIRRDKSLGERIVFKRNKSGKVIGMKWHSNYRKKLK